MYSTNGRQKQTKETAATKVKDYVLICDSCGYEQEDASKVFGEVSKCLKCESEKVHLAYK